MKTNVSPSSIQTYHGVVIPMAPRVQTLILRVMARRNGWWSRKQIAKHGNLEINTVCGRVNELIEAGHLIESDELMRCPITGRAVSMVRINDELRRVA